MCNIILNLKVFLIDNQEKPNYSKILSNIKITFVLFLMKYSSEKNLKFLTTLTKLVHAVFKFNRLHFLETLYKAFVKCSSS